MTVTAVLRFLTLAILAVSAMAEDAPRDVTLRAHLAGHLADDPFVLPGETIRYVPDRTDRLTSLEPVLVRVPSHVPQAVAAEEICVYIQGWIVGYVSSRDAQVQCYSGASEARRHAAWDAGWADGYAAEQEDRAPGGLKYACDDTRAAYFDLFGRPVDAPRGIAYGYVRIPDGGDAGSFGVGQYALIHAGVVVEQHRRIPAIIMENCFKPEMDRRIDLVRIFTRKRPWEASLRSLGTTGRATATSKDHP